MTDSVRRTVHVAVGGQSLRVAMIFIALGSASLSWPAVAEPATSAARTGDSERLEEIVVTGTLLHKCAAGRSKLNLVGPTAGPGAKCDQYRPAADHDPPGQCPMTRAAFVMRRTRADPHVPDIDQAT